VENVLQVKEPGKMPTGRSAILRSAEGLAAPLSFAQQQIWVHAQLVPEISVYNEPVTIHRHRTLDKSALENALNEIVRRHEAWRTTFTLVDGEPVQTIQPAAPVELSWVDLRHLPAAEREAEGQRLAAEDAIRPFDLSRGPLFRGLLVCIDDTDHRLFLTLHHIIFDGYSIYRVLLPELATLYAAFSAGERPTLPELPVQYADFARWEREWFARNGHLASQLAYWRQQLGANLPVLELPFDHPRQAIQTFRGSIQPVAISKRLGDALKLLSRREGATLFMTLLACFAILLQRYSSLEDVPIGTVSSGRKRSELEGLLGYFLNLLVLRNDLSGDPTFCELLRRTRNVTLDGLSNDDAPFSKIVEEVQPNRSLGLSPLFQVLFTLEPPLPETQDGWTVALTQPGVDTGISKFDLALELDDRPSGIVGRFKYSADLFEPATIARMAGHFATLLESVAANPESRISKLAILSGREQRQLRSEWNETDTEYPQHLCLHHLFTNQVERTPDSVALIGGEETLTYRELDRRSNLLAAYLQKRGVGAEVPVGLYFEPSAEMIVSIIAVLKAGGACVPLDPSYPEERLVYVLADTRLRVLLTQQHLRDRVPAHHDTEDVSVDSDWPQIASEGKDGVRGQCTPENLAYVIYTSGSTGKPKGVQVTHCNLVHSTHARSVYYDETVGRFLLLSSFAFDSSLVGIFGTLSGGGTLVLKRGPVQANLNQLAQLVEHHQVSHLLCVPSLYSHVLEQGKAGQLDSLRVAIVAGETCPSELVERHYKLVPHAALFNEYGPTEAAVWSTVYKCVPGRFAKPVPIGRPIPNVRVYVLDPHQNLAPIGVAGEIYIGGPGVVRGYLNQPAETAAKFIPDPFSEVAGSRLYKTGDLARYLPDGNLELLGRLDHQVKIRGFRIELEEIEATISEYAGVRQVVVALRKETTGEPKLIAYIVPANPAQFDTEGLVSFISKKLPAAMVPAAFVRLGSLPLMPNGKVNRGALPLHGQEVSVKQFVPPTEAVQVKLAEIWKGILSARVIGAADNFFDLGGNSLLVAKLLLRIEQEYGKRLSLANIFQAPTIRQLAEMLEDRSGSIPHPAVVPIQPHGAKPPLFWVRGGPLFRPLANRLGTDQPLLGLHLPTSDARRLQVPYKLEEVAGALVSRMREVQPEGPYYLAGLCVNGVIAYEMARQLCMQQQQVALLVLFDAQNPAYYEDFSHESRGRLLQKRIQFQLSTLRRNGLPSLPGFVRERLIGIQRRLTVRYWRMYHALRLRVDVQRLEDMESIVHPASFVYRPQPYPGRVVFFQSTDWPVGQYWDFHASWNGLISGGLELHKIRGGHESMFYEQNVDLLASKLQRCLSESMRDRLQTAERVS
jgi:surfactin family lipopeptide synthetase A